MKCNAGVSFPALYIIVCIMHLLQVISLKKLKKARRLCNLYYSWTCTVFLLSATFGASAGAWIRTELENSFSSLIGVASFFLLGWHIFLYAGCILIQKGNRSKFKLQSNLLTYMIWRSTPTCMSETVSVFTECNLVFGNYATWPEWFHLCKLFRE